MVARSYGWFLPTCAPAVGIPGSFHKRPQQLGPMVTVRAWCCLPRAREACSGSPSREAELRHPSPKASEKVALLGGGAVGPVPRVVREGMS